MSILSRSLRPLARRLFLSATAKVTDDSPTTGNSLNELVDSRHRQRRSFHLYIVSEGLRLQILLRIHGHVPRDLDAGIGRFARHDAGQSALGDAHRLVQVRSFAEDALYQVEMLLL